MNCQLDYWHSNETRKFNMSKGSGRRPISVPRKKFDDQWDKIFTNPRKPKKEENEIYNQK